jgi:phage shock protein C
MKKLVRLPKEGKITGMCAGLARYLEVDVTVVRVAVLAAVTLSGVVPGTVFYFVAALITPAKGEKNAKA